MIVMDRFLPSDALRPGRVWRAASMNKEGDKRLLKAYLADIINSRLRRNVPGLYASLSMFTYSRFGEYPGELLYDNPEAFLKLLKEHFMDDEMVRRVVKYMLTPIEEEGSEGRKAVEALLYGKFNEFRQLLEKFLASKARKWSKGLLH
ncbi:MAG: hypothetical protein J7L55_03815 [Desulfurococcales archaeon]|nr:hypothetical protein [Desulfurococcales archaeon]